MRIVYRLVVGTAGYWGKVTLRGWRGMERHTLELQLQGWRGFRCWRERHTSRKTLLRLEVAGLGEPFPQQDAAGWTLKSPDSCFIASLVHVFSAGSQLLWKGLRHTVNN